MFAFTEDGRAYYGGQVAHAAAAHTGCVSKNLTLKILPVKKHSKSRFKTRKYSFQNVSFFNFVLVKRQMSLKYK